MSDRDQNFPSNTTGYDTNVPHNHMQGTGKADKKRYLRFKAATMLKTGVVVWCQHCDKLISKHCILSETESTFYNAVNGTAITTKKKPLPNIGYLPGQANLYRLLAKIPEPPPLKKKKWPEKRRKRRKVVPKKKDPYVIEPENITELPDVSENLHAPQSLVSQIKINISNKPKVPSVDNGGKKDEAATTTAVSIHQSCSTFSETDIYNFEVQSSVQMSLSSKPLSCSSSESDHSDVTAFATHKTAPTYSRTNQKRPECSVETTSWNQFTGPQLSVNTVNETVGHSIHSLVCPERPQRSRKRESSAPNRPLVSYTDTSANWSNHTSMVGHLASKEVTVTSTTFSQWPEPRSSTTSYVDLTQPSRATPDVRPSVSRLDTSGNWGDPAAVNDVPRSSTFREIEMPVADNCQTVRPEDQPNIPFAAYAPRTGVPRAFNCRMLGEMEMNPDYQVNRNNNIIDIDSDPEPNTRPVAAMPDLVLSVGRTEVSQSQQRRADDSLDRRKPHENEKEKPPNTEEITPIHKRDEIIRSVDQTVLSLVKKWPWKEAVKTLEQVSAISRWTTPHDYASTSSRPILEKNFQSILSVSARRDYWVQITVTRYPEEWTRTEVLDKVINWRTVADLPIAPCFIEFTPRRCKFLVRDCHATLQHLFSRGLVVHDDDCWLELSIAMLSLSQKDLRFRLQRFLEHRLSCCYSENRHKLDLRGFLLEPDISMMCHFPLNKPYNQRHIVEMESKIRWNQVTKLILAGNRLTSIEHFRLSQNLPALKSLDLRNNRLGTVIGLSCCRGMTSIRSLWLEGNPLCHGFVQRDLYSDAVRLLFPRIGYLDGVKVSGLPEPVRNFCPELEAHPLVEQFLEMYFGLLESRARRHIDEMYDFGAILTVCCHSKLKKHPDYEDVELVQAGRDIRQLNEVYEGSLVGNECIARRLEALPPVCHDPATFTVDVVCYTENVTILTLTGSLRVLSHPLPQECPLLDFSRTFVLSTRDGAQYVISNDLWSVALPTAERRAAAFKRVEPKPLLTLHLETAPDEELANELITILMTLTRLNRSQCSRCLEMRNWNLRAALQYFLDLENDDELSTLDHSAGYHEPAHEDGVIVLSP